MRKPDGLLEDKEILIRFKEDKNPNWIGLLFERYTHLLLGLCLKYLKNEEDAQDAVQQIFLKVINDLSRYEIRNFKAWLYQVGKNYCLMKLRSPIGRTIVEIKERIFEKSVETNSSEILAKELKLNKLDEAIEKLNADQKLCIKLFYLEMKSYKQIAFETGFSPMQVKSHLQNGKRNLKIFLLKNLNLENK